MAKAAPREAYIGQVRGLGCRNWRTVTGYCQTGALALSAALRTMYMTDHRARALRVSRRPSWYGPTVVFECVRRHRGLS